MTILVKIIVLSFVSVKFKRIHDQEASRLSLVESSNVITTPSLYNVTTDDLQIAVLLKTTEGDTYKGKPIDYYVTVHFEIETQLLVNGEFQLAYDTFYAVPCT